MTALLIGCGNKNKQEAVQTASKEQKEATTDAAVEQYQDIELPNVDGKNIKLSDFVSKNKLTLVDFWASWCPPCRAEMPNLVQAYSDFHGKGLEIVGVSLDQDKTSWTDALKQMNMTWPQMSDLKGWESAAAAAYGVRGIPYTVLINQKGEIIAKNLRGEDLHRILAEQLK